MADESWLLNTTGKSAATLAGTTELRVIDDPSGTPTSKKTTMTAIAAFAIASLLSSQAANKVLAGPTSGGSATAAFRSLVAADIPDLSSVYATTASLSAYAALASANTFTATQTISGAGLIISGNQSAAAWTTNGLRLKGVSGTLTDTSSSGTVAAAYTNVLGGNTIAASSAVTFTNYYSTFLSEPTAGTNVTFTNKWALGLGGGLNIAGSANANVLKSTGYSLTGSNATSMIDLAGTLNTTGSPDVFALRITDTARGASTKFFNIYGGASGTTSVFSIDRIGAASLGGELYVGAGGTSGGGNPALRLSVGSDGMSLTRGDTSATGFTFYALGVGATSTGKIGFISGNLSGNTFDVYLSRDAANTLALQNGTNAQTLNIYNTWSSAGTNYERLGAYFSANVAYLASEAGGSGTKRPLIVDGNIIYFASSTSGAGNARWYLSASGHFLGFADNTYDLGASGANRPRNVFVGSSLTTGSSIDCGGTLIVRGTNGQISLNGRGVMLWPSDGVLRLTNDAGTDFNRLQFGGTTSSFPALKRDGVGISARLSDDSDGTWVKMLRTTAASLPSASTAGAGAKATVTDATTPALGVAVTGGGASQCTVTSDGTNWIVG